MLYLYSTEKINRVLFLIVCLLVSLEIIETTHLIDIEYVSSK